MSLEGNDPVIGHGGRVSFARNQGGQPVTNGQRDLWGKGSSSLLTLLAEMRLAQNRRTSFKEPIAVAEE